MTAGVSSFLRQEIFDKCKHLRNICRRRILCGLTGKIGGFPNCFLSTERRSKRKLIRNVNYATTKINNIQADKVIDLANTYIKSGKCRRAEKVYRYFIDISEQTNEQGEYLRFDFAYLKFYVELAGLYQNVLHKDKNAEMYFDKLVAESKKDRTDGETPYIEYRFADRELFKRIGDFYFAKNDYPQAGEFYEYCLKKIEKDEKNSVNFPVKNSLCKFIFKENWEILTVTTPRLPPNITRRQFQILKDTVRLESTLKKLPGILKTAVLPKNSGLIGRKFLKLGQIRKELKMLPG